jgi:hypothetical protein
MASPREVYRRLPISVRRVLVLRAQRRWIRAVAYRRWHNQRVGSDAPTVNFFPMLPEPRMQVSWMLRALRMRIGTSPQAGEPTFAWETGTWFDERAVARLPPDAINGHCLDVSKSRVDSLWEEVAGYSISVDPTTWTGLLVEKPEENGTHDGRLRRGPLARRAGFVYQKLIDSRVDGVIHSTRPVIIGGAIPVVLAFTREGPNWFYGTNYCRAVTAADAYSAGEQKQLLAFAAAIGMEFGELDVFRDRQSGLIYVIDANRTSFGPSHLPLGDFRTCVRAVVPALRRLLDGRGTVASRD